MGRKRLIMHNDGHALDRIASNLAHEAAHALLLHEPRQSLDSSGCRDWHDDVEKCRHRTEDLRRRQTGRTNTRSTATPSLA